jgi:Mg2+ and Co2+ transporter CorA
MTIWAVELDFEQRVHARIEAGAVSEAIDSGRFVWIDMSPDDFGAIEDLIVGFEIPEEVIEDASTEEAATQAARYSNCLHMIMSGCDLHENHFELRRVDAIVGETFLLTVHRAPVDFIERTKADFPDDFNQFEERVEQVQSRLIGDVDDGLFKEIGAVAADLVHFRKVLLPARAVLSDLATRKSRFVSEATQPFLANMVGTVERILQDLLADREILNDSLNLHVSAVSHRTNEGVRRLTGVSVIFLPLTFLVGVYGMNFEVLPELKWRMGYALFWGVVATTTISLLVLLRRKKLL